MKAIHIFCGILLLLTSKETRAQSTNVRFHTTQGDIDVMLYDDTPRHRDMFLTEIKKGTYKQAEFNRVIKDFVCQGGELDETILEREKLHSETKPLRFPSEILAKHFHKRGALGAGRDDNKEKAAYYSQLYFVVGKQYTDTQLDSLEDKRQIKIAPERRIVYKQQGGIPYLDGDYTVFGEVIKGLEIVEAINKVSTDAHDRPLEAQVFSIEVIKRK